MLITVLMDFVLHIYIYIVWNEPWL